MINVRLRSMECWGDVASSQGRCTRARGVFYHIINEDDVENILKEETVQKA